MTWFEGLTVVGVMATVGVAVAKKALVKGVKKATGKDIGAVLDVGEKVCVGTVHTLQQAQPQPPWENQAHTVEVVAYDRQLPENTSGVTCPGCEVSPPREIIQQGPEIFVPQKLRIEGYDIVPPAIVVQPGREILQPEKGSNITGIEPVYLSDLPFILTKTIQDILDESEPGDKTNGQSTIYVKPGSSEVASEDFDSLGLTGIRDIGQGKRMGLLPDGITVVVRPVSGGKRDPATGKNRNDGPPTLEIQEGSGKKIKIRYIGN
jgi:hypothetical protein